MRTAAALLALACTLTAAETVWVEGEAAATTTFKPHSWYSQAVRSELLSGGRWLSTFDGPADAAASWRIELPAAGDWRLWLRANPVQAGLDWRLDGGAWRALDLAGAVDRVNLANDGKPDLRFLAWIPAGTQTLGAGAHRLELRTTARLNHHAAIDALLLTTDPALVPAGKLPPGTVPSEAEPGWFAADPGRDPLDPAAALDLRPLNEKRAGALGRLRAEGGRLLRGDGAPLRLWGVNAGSGEGLPAARFLMARLARSGVNAVRLHGLIADRSGDDPRALSARALADLHANVAAAAEQGIYVHLSTYYPLWLQLKPGDGVADGAMGKHPFSLLLFEPEFQRLWRAWAKAVLASRNPHTGLTLAEDPAVAFWEIQNEDSLLFWTATRDNLGAGPWRTLCTLFGAWAAKRHGSRERALAAWGGQGHGDDDAAAGRLGLFPPWDTTRDGLAKAGAGKRARIADQVRFCAEQSRDAYAALAAFVRDECGFRGVITASNWMTADDRRQIGIERWTYAAAADAVDRHGYFGGRHEGDAAGWSLRPGQTYADRAAVLEPAATPLAYLRLAGRPHLFSEVAWNRPNRFTADGIPLVAAYSALQGTDAVFTFAARSGAWQGDGGEKWPLMTPAGIGQFPAAALLFRRGDLRPAPPALRLATDADRLLALAGPEVGEGRSADAQAAGPSPAAGAAGDDGLAFLAGPVELAVAGLAGAPAGPATRAADLDRRIDRAARTATSLTGELRWDWGRGLVTWDAARCQGATGFLARAGEVRLGAIAIRCGNEYGTVQAVSLDDAPLATSRRILVQAMSEERLYGWRAEGGRIADLGRPPLNVRELDVQVRFAAGAGLRATALDLNGRAAGRIELADGVLRLPKDRLRVLVER